MVRKITFRCWFKRGESSTTFRFLKSGKSVGLESEFTILDKGKRRRRRRRMRRKRNEGLRKRGSERGREGGKGLAAPTRQFYESVLLGA